MLVQFDKRFKDSILNGSKTSTMIIHVDNAFRTGTEIEFSIDGDIVKKAKCVLVHCITIDTVNKTVYSTYGNRMNSTKVERQFTDESIEDLATEEGFETVADFWEWFNTDRYEEKFKAKIIYWLND